MPLITIEDAMLSISSRATGDVLDGELLVHPGQDARDAKIAQDQTQAHDTLTRWAQVYGLSPGTLERARFQLDRWFEACEEDVAKVFDLCDEDC